MTSEDRGLRIAVTGATGNVGTSVIEELGRRDGVASIHGIARRDCAWTAPAFRLTTADLASDDLDELLRGTDMLIHLAWLFQPTRDPLVTWRANVLGSIRVFEAAARAGVPAVVYGSSVGAYSPGPKDRAVTEQWPTHGSPEAAYTREKAYVERFLDAYELDNPQIRVARLRPGFVFKRASASQQRRLFAGPLVPGSLARPGAVPAVPDIPGLRVQAVHTDDLAEAYVQAALRPVRGAFNVAAEPPIDPSLLADLLHARTVPVPAAAARAALSAAWRLRAVPATPGLFDAVLRMPIMDCTRARRELEWVPKRTATEAISEFLSGLRAGAGLATAPLEPGHHLHEFGKGVGSRP